MPIYQYVCEDCGRTTEIIQKYDDPAPICKKCFEAEGNTVEMTKMISTCTTFVLKGGCWARDGYSGSKK